MTLESKACHSPVWRLPTWCIKLMSYFFTVCGPKYTWLY